VSRSVRLKRVEHLALRCIEAQSLDVLPGDAVKRARDPGGPCEGEPVPHRVEVGGGANDGCGVGDAEGYIAKTRWR